MPHVPHMLTNLLQADSQASQIDAILDAVRHHLGMEIAFASRYVSDGERFTERQFTHLSSDLPLPSKPGDSEPIENGYCWHVLNGRLPELIHDAQQIDFAHTMGITAALPVGCHISVPLRLKDGSVYGSFCCLSRTADHSLTDRDLQTVRAFAELAATQIEKEQAEDRLREEGRQRLQQAMCAGQPSIVLQPIHDLAGGGPIGVEALSRFPDQRPPDRWFAEAEQIGLGLKLGIAAVQSALAALPYVPDGRYLAINAAPALVLSGVLEPLLAQAPAGRIVLEITEHAEVEDYRALHAALAPLAGHVRIAVDDVGAGYSGLRHILDLAPDILKLDMSLTRDVDADPARRALIDAMVRFAAGIGCTLIAEGIERQGELDVLRALGVGAGQGWLFSRALPPVAAQHYLLGVACANQTPAPVRPKRRAAA